MEHVQSVSILLIILSIWPPTLGAERDGCVLKSLMNMNEEEKSFQLHFEFKKN